MSDGDRRVLELPTKRKVLYDQRDRVEVSYGRYLSAHLQERVMFRGGEAEKIARKSRGYREA